MSTKQPSFRVHDALASVATQPPLLPLRGRTAELARIARCIRRHTHTNLILTGPSGVGKTRLLAGFIEQVAAGKYATTLRPLPYLELDTATAVQRLQDSLKKEEAASHLAAAFASLPACVFIIDEADALLASLEPAAPLPQIFAAFLDRVDRHLVLILTEEKIRHLHEQYPSLLKFFEVLALNELSTSTCRAVVIDYAPTIAHRYQITIEQDALTSLLEVSKSLVPKAAFPLAALHSLDKAASACALAQAPVLTSEHVRTVAAQVSGAPVPTLTPARRQNLQQLSETLSAHVRGQAQAVKKVATTMQRVWLGLKQPDRPLSSMLFLGPSGVGKTELARVVAEELYGSRHAFVRLDMSEFKESLMVQRLLGAPPGYVGYEAGGQLTNPVLKQPFSLVLLDEIEKAHPNVFDMFLQVFDDGRLTDGQGTTVDFTKTVIVATSNIGVGQIVQAHESGADVADPIFLRKHLVPDLLAHFRPEFLNRFEDIVVFNPLTPAVLIDIARLEMQKITARLSSHHVQLALSDDVLARKVHELYDPRFGARPIKRFVEQLCESALAERMLQR